ncbi:hypothetical protein ACFLUP_03790 [Chloroflexota bacterium]
MAELKRITTPFSYSSAVAAGNFVFITMNRCFGGDLTAKSRDSSSHLKNSCQSSV